MLGIMKRTLLKILHEIRNGFIKCAIFLVGVHVFENLKAAVKLNYGRFAYCLFAYVLSRFAYVQYVSSNLCKNI